MWVGRVTFCGLRSTFPWVEPLVGCSEVVHEGATRSVISAVFGGCCTSKPVIGNEENNPLTVIDHHPIALFPQLVRWNFIFRTAIPPEKTRLLLLCKKVRHKNSVQGLSSQNSCKDQKCFFSKHILKFGWVSKWIVT